jgi:asparagine synthase (glutamine-hydrolysing)
VLLAAATESTRNDESLFEASGILPLLAGRVRLGIGRGPRETIERSGNVTVAALGACEARMVAQAYERRGLKCICDLPGSFAFVVHDEAQQRTVAACDARGFIPLAYWASGGRFVVASRVLPLLRHPEISSHLDDTYLAHVVLGYRAIPGGMTALRDVRRLPGGHALVVERGTFRLMEVDRLSPATCRAGEARRTFWSVLEGALPQPSPTGNPCLALSGGLDSSIVGSALLRRMGPLSAFSLMAKGLGQTSDDRLVASFERAFPSARVHRIDVTDAVDLPVSDLHDFDDPQLTPLGLWPARTRLWRMVREAGFTSLYDGEGGDELFEILLTPMTALNKAAAGVAWRYLKARTHRRFRAQAGLLLPLLPRAVRGRWLDRITRTWHVEPSYLRAGAQELPAFRLARGQYHARLVNGDYAKAVRGWLSSPSWIGSLLCARLVAERLGVELVSPLLERGMIEFAMGLPPEAMLRPQQKGFLRDVAEGTVPDVLRNAPKDTRLAEELLARILVSPVSRGSFRDLSVRQRIDSWVRFDRVEGMLDRIAAGDRPGPRVMSQLEGLLAFAQWYKTARAEYNVS